MRLHITSAFLAAAFLAPLSGQTTRYVNKNVGGGAGTGLTWADAFTSISAALAASSSGDTVWIASSFYFESLNVPAGVTVKGRFLPGFFDEIQREVNNQVIVNNGGTGRILTMGAGSWVDGLSIQGGVAGAPGGGGALVDGVDCKISNCFFLLNNDTVGAGAALLVRNGANPQIENNVFYLNGDVNSGAAIEVDNASGTFINNTVDTNEYSGMRLTNGATPKIYNSIFSNNGVVNARVARGIEQLDTGSNPQLHYNLFFNNSTSMFLRGATEIGTLGGLNGLGYASNNIAGDPQFDTPIAVYKLAQTSPAVDAGSPVVFPQSKQGIYDFTRRLDGNFDGGFESDIGASEYSDVSFRISVDTHTHVHLVATSNASNPIFIMLGAGPSPVPGGFLLPGMGFFYIDPAALIVFPLPPSQTLDYNVNCPLSPGTPLYMQALTTQGGGLHLSMAAVHLLNC